MNLNLWLFVFAVLLLESEFGIASDKLVMDSDYDVQDGCFDHTLGRHRRIQLNSAADIQERIISKDFECTEMTDVIIEAMDNNGIGMLVHGDLPHFKVVGIKGTGGSLAKAGVYDLNFRGAKVTNLFLDYQVAIGGDARGLVSNGIYLAFYAHFAAQGCNVIPLSESLFPQPTYALAPGVLSVETIFGPENRLFMSGLVACIP